MPIMRFLVACTIEAKIHLRGPILSERSLCFAKNAPDHIAMIYFVFAFTRVVHSARLAQRLAPDWSRANE